MCVCVCLGVLPGQFEGRQSAEWGGEGAVWGGVFLLLHWLDKEKDMLTINSQEPEPLLIGSFGTLSK